MSKEFACFVVKTHFGPQYAALISPLIDNEELMLSELARDAKMEVEELRPMLILLLKNSIIEFTEKATSPGSSVTHYRLNVENVINIALYPRYLAFFEEKVSVLARSLSENLMLGGMMTVEELLQVTKDSIGMELEGEELKEQDFFQEIGTLVTLNYFVPVHKSAPVQHMDLGDHATLGKRKPDKELTAKGQSSKKIKSSKNFLVEDTIAAGKLIEM